MTSQHDKEDVLVNVGVELAAMFDKLKSHYTKEEFRVGLPELQSIEPRLKECLAEYDPLIDTPGLDDQPPRAVEA